MTRSQLLTPIIEDASWADGRGAILTFIPPFDIKEFNVVYFKAAATRGNHFHEHFWEIFGVLGKENHGIFCCIDTETGEDVRYHLTQSNFVITPPHCSHAFFALNDCVCMSFLSRKWCESFPPITHQHVTTKPQITKTPLVS